VAGRGKPTNNVQTRGDVAEGKAKKWHHRTLATYGAVREIGLQCLAYPALR